MDKTLIYRPFTELPPVEHLRNCHEMKLLITPGVPVDDVLSKWFMLGLYIMTNLRFMGKKNDFVVQ